MKRESSPTLTQTNQGLVSHGGVNGTFVLLAIFIVTKCCTVKWEGSAFVAPVMWLLAASQQGTGVSWILQLIQSATG